MSPSNPVSGLPPYIESGIIRNILDKLDEIALIVNTKGEIIYGNKAFLRLYEYTENQIIGYKIYDPQLGITTESRLMDTLKATRDHGGRLKYERETINRGRKRFSEITLISFNMMGEEHFLYMSKDITDLKISQMQAEGLNDMLNVIIDNLPVYLFVKDVEDDLRYLIWNKAFAEYSKIPADKVIGRTDFEVFPDLRDAQAFRDDDLSVVENGEMTMKQETYMAADGKTRVVQTYKTLIHRQRRGPLLVGISLDVTDIQGIEKELVRARVRAEESDRLKSRFLANMSHEIRTPLNAIVGFAGLLPDAEDKETEQNYINIINENTELLLQLINDILDLSKIEAGTLEYNRAPMDLYEMFRNMIFTYKERLHRNVELFFDNDNQPQSLIVHEDRNRLMQVMDNLINNAIKFTEKGEIHYGFNFHADHIEVYVRDTGRGIPKDKLEYVFDRFVKLDNFVQGSGLGLAICKLIVETLGGKISVKSEEGKGATFSFTIPYRTEPAAAQENAEEEKVAIKPLLANNNRTILIAEDVNSNFLLVKSMLKGRFNIIWAKDGEEAVEITRKENPDLILMDIHMPCMNGLDATREIRKFNTEVPIVALTANAYDNDRIRSLQAGMNDFLPKPINRDAFEAILAACL